MTYFPVVPSADNRRKKGLTPLRLQNWFVEPVSAGANKPDKAVIVPTPGKVARVDLGAPISGVYAENGVRNGLLFAVAGDNLYSISSEWAATLIGAIGGSGNACFEGLRDKLFVSRGAKPWQWDGTTLVQATDIDAPNVKSMIVLSLRVLAIEEGGDTLYWSAQLNGVDWEALGFATAEQRSDVAYALVRLSGQALVLGATGIEVLRATGSATLPFANVTSQSIEESDGVIGPDAWARSGDKVYIVGGNLTCYALAGFAISPLPANGELEDELASLTAEQRLTVNCWAYRRGSHDFFVVRLPGRHAFVLDLATRLWHTRKTWEQDTYLPRYHTRAYGKNVLAEDGGSVLYTYEETVFTDGDNPIERIATLRPGFAQNEAVGNMCIDLQAFGRPAEGLGSEPVLMIDIASDGRTQRDDSRAEVTTDIGADGTYLKPMVWGLGDFTPGEGATITVRLTDPIGLSLYGVWLNDGQM